MGMYDKLGDMLNDYLETGRMPPPRARAENHESAHEPQSHTRTKRVQKTPEYLINDFYELGFTNLLETPQFSQVKRKYRAALKALHPDTAAKKDADNKLPRLVEAFKRVNEWYRTGGSEPGKERRPTDL